MSAVEDALEALGHPHGALPEPRLLADLFVRFQAQVPLREAPEGRGAEAALAAWLEDGEGSCGEGRVAAFEALASAAGFDLEHATARDASGAERPVHLADRRRVLLDAGFPLPVPLLLDPPAEGTATGYGTLSVRPGERGGSEVRLETRGDERPLFRVEVAGADAARGDTGSRVAATRRGGVAGEPALRDPGLFRLLDDRLLRWRDGVLEVSDAWSRLRVPVEASDADGLEALFGPPAPEAGPPGRVGRHRGFDPTLAVYHASAEEPSRLARLLAEPATHAALLPRGWAVEGLAVAPGGFERTLVEDGALLRRERFTLLPDGVAVEAEGPLALFRTRTWRLEPRPAGTRLRLLAALRDPVPPRGLAEGARRRLVFELASELLELDRFSFGA